ncbi:MAG: 16S rRNA (guanine(527)-N(7))-methyltransferase RsmG [Gammaproteobacteria bacterium]
MTTLARRLADGINALGLSAESLPRQKFLAYIELLSHWNRAYNLTAVRDPAEMVAYHLLDSLSLLPFLPDESSRCLDMGTGPGLPGMILALARPDQFWVLLDSNAKKIRFLNQARIEFKLDNVEIVRSRVESYQPVEKFDYVVARALAELGQLCDWARPLTNSGAQLLALKAEPGTAELAALTGQTYQQHSLKVPGIDAPRSLVVVCFA